MEKALAGGTVAWRGVAWRGVEWRGVAWRGTPSECELLNSVRNRELAQEDMSG